MSKYELVEEELIPFPYKNLVLDVGKVMLEYRFEDMMKDHGLSEECIMWFFKNVFPDPLWPEFDLARYSYDQVVDMYMKKYPEAAKELKWFFSHCELMTNPREDVWERVHELRAAGMKVFLLSNYAEEMFKRHTKGCPFMEDLDGEVISYQVHMCKPDPAIYQALFDKYDLLPGECIFFDDRLVNVEGSIACGMDAVLVTGRSQLCGELDKLIRRVHD